MWTRLKDFFKKIDYKDIIIFLIPFLVFGAFLYIYFPGILSNDSYTQLSQIRSGEFYSWHPFIHTFIEMMCLKIWNSPASIGIFQISIFSLIWTVICKYNRKTSSSKIFIFEIIVTVLIVINPINAIHSITLWKDVIFSYLILLISFCVQITIDKHYKINNSLSVFLGFIMALASTIRPNGVFCCLIVLIVLSVLVFKNNKKLWPLLKLPLFFVLFYLSILSLNKIYHVKNNDKPAINLKLMHMVSYYELKGYLSSEDIAIVNNVISEKAVEDNYNPYFLDTIYYNMNNDNVNLNKSKLIKMALSSSIKHPVSFLRYMFKSSTMAWAIVKPDDMIGTILWLDIAAPNNTENIVPLNINNSFYLTVNQKLHESANNDLAYALLYSPATYFYLSILLIVVMLLKKKVFILLIYLTNMLNVIIVSLSTPIQDIRYLYPTTLVFYFILILVTKEFVNSKEAKK